MLIATIFLLGLGLVASIMLAIASKVFYVWEDPRIEKVEEALLGANCGGCGYAGCSAAAEAVVFGKANADICVAGGFEIAQNVAAVLGLKVEEKEPEISHPGCTYSLEEAELKFNYDGILDCKAAMLIYGGSKECHIGCLGMGTCVRACPFGALSMGANNLPIVNKERCTSCGICAEICPKDIITLTSASKRIISDQKVSECTAPCQRSCPAEIDIPSYIREINKGDYPAALRVIREKNPFPLICGWICPAPCELSCRRNLIDEPVSINSLKKFVSEYEMKSGITSKPYIAPESGKTISVIGGGVEGLTASYFLKRLGHSPKVIESTEKLGGILRYIISEDRLPRDVIDWEINHIMNTGIEADIKKTVGKNYTLPSLINNGSDLVLLTAGGWDSRQILRGNKEFESVIPGTHLLLDFLVSFSKGNKKQIGKNAVIIGGGKTALKAANICLNNGAQEATIVYPYSKIDAEEIGIEIKESDQINYIFSAVPVEIQGKGEALTKVLTCNTELTIEKEITELNADTLIIGAGRLPEMLFEKVNEDGWKTVEVFKVFAKESNIGIFSVGETGRSSDLTGVVIAVGRGRKMARAIHLYLSEDTISPEEGFITDENDLQNVYKINEAENLSLPKGVINNKITLTEQQSQKEAVRCLDCGLICYKKELDKEKIHEISA
jgi:formate dehydrogenase beta subunit